MIAKTSRVSVALLMVAGSGEALAQVADPADPAPAASRSNEIEDIIVTARRREETQQTIPVAVTAFNAEALQAANITELENLSAVAPGLTVTPLNSRGNVPGFSIRGQRQGAGDVASDPSVVVYLAEAAQVRPFGLASALFDIESVQVLRGPQGTLFGRNTTGGAILVQPNRPQLGELSGYTSVRVGNLDRFDVQAVLNIPVTDDIAVRLGYNRVRRDGYVTNVSTGLGMSGEHTDTFRGSILFQPSSSLRNTLFFDYFKADQSGTGFRITAVRAASTGAARYPLVATLERFNNELGFYEIEGDLVGRSSGEAYGFTNVTEFDISDTLRVKNIAGMRYMSSNDAQELDGTNFPVLQPVDFQQATQFSEELQFQGEAFDGNLTWIVGGYYFWEEGFRRTLTVSLGSVPPNRFGRVNNVSYSIFAQGDYKIVPDVTLTVGGRYTWDERDFLQTMLNGTTGACIICAPNRSKSFSAPTYTVNLAWQIDEDRMVYAAHRRGYRTGGFNSGATTLSATAPFDEETVTDFELGFKADWRVGGSALRTNFAIYRSNYTDIQRLIITFIGTDITNSIFNAASATIQGAEAEIQFFPIPELELVGSASYTDPDYQEFLVANPDGSVSDLSNNTFAFIPKWTARLGARLDVPLSSGSERRFIAALDWVYQSRIFYNETNSLAGSAPGYGLLSGRLEVKNVVRGLDLALWSRNLLDKQYYYSGSDSFSSALGILYEAPGEPRTFGIEARFAF